MNNFRTARLTNPSESAAPDRLQRLEQRYRLTLENCLDAFITMDQGGIVREWNPQAEHIFGWPRNEAVGRALHDLIIPPEHRAAHKRGLENFLQTGGGPLLNRRVEIEALRKDGRRIPIELSITPIEYEGWLFTAFARDLGERKKLDDALRESEQRLQLFIEHAPAALAMFDREMRYLAASRRWELDYDLDHENIIGRSHYDVFPEIPAAWKDVHRRGLSGEVVGTEEDSLVRANGRVQWMRWVVRPWFTARDSVGGIVIFSEDITTRKQTQQALLIREAELRQLNAQLEERVAERSATLEARSKELARSNIELEQFAYVASHDLQEPLRKIRAFGDLLALGYKDQLGDEGRDYIHRMQSAAERMQTLIDDLLMLSRVMRKGQSFEPVNLNEVVRSVVGDLEQRTRDSGGRIDAGELPTLDADPTQMRQLFQNLIGNGLKFHLKGMPPVVTIAAKTARRRGRPALTAAGGWWQITVEDNGIGFDPQHAERIFQPFQRLHGRGEYEGTGIGLTICRRIVQEHGGTIRAEGRAGGGAMFIVTLPAARISKERPDVAAHGT